MKAERFGGGAGGGGGERPPGVTGIRLGKEAMNERGKEGEF